MGELEKGLRYVVSPNKKMAQEINTFIFEATCEALEKVLNGQEFSEHASITISNEKERFVLTIQVKEVS